MVERTCCGASEAHARHRWRCARDLRVRVRGAEHRRIAAAGAEFVRFDTEHTGWGAETGERMIAGRRGTRAMPLARVPRTQLALMTQPLDLGAMGPDVPDAGGGEGAQRPGRSGRAPAGGAPWYAFGMAHDDFELGDPAARMRQANEQTLLIAPVETHRGARTTRRRSPASPGSMSAGSHGRI